MKGEGKSCLARRHKMSFLVFRLDALGDVVMTTPLFRELKRCFPDARCTVVVQEAYRSLFVTNPFIDEILTVRPLRSSWLPKQAQVLVSTLIFGWARLRGRRYDVAISPRWDTDEHLATFLCLMANVGARVGYTEKTSPRKRLLNRGFDGAFDVCLPPGPLQHEVLRNLAVLDALGASPQDDGLEIRLTTRDRRHAAQILQAARPSARLVALGIGAQAAGRCWPLERFALVIAGLAKHFPVQPVIVCSADEREPAAKLANQLPVPPIVLSGHPLRQTCAVLERCDLFLGNDSGPAHLAAAMDCKTLVIARHPRSGDLNHANSPIRFGPHCRDKRILQPARGLGTCEDGCNLEQPHCILAVTVDEAVAAALDMLEVAPRVAACSGTARVEALWETLPFLRPLAHAEPHVRI